MGAQDLISAITGGLSQSGRLLRLDTPLGANVLVPQRVVGRSRLGRHFEFTVDVVSTSGGIELKTLIAQPVTLWIQQTDQSYLPHNGYVHTARRLGSNSGLTSYQLGFASWMHLLKFRRDQRLWQDKSADDIITDVFNTHPQAQGLFQFALSKPLPSRSYCRQDEDDWNFVHRLLESEGLYGFWQQAQDGKSHTLVITDRLTTLDMLSPETVPFYRAGTDNETDAFTQWSGTRTLQSTLLTTRTFDYKSPSTRFNPKGTNVPTMPNQGALPNQAEVYEYTGAYTYPKQARGDQLSGIRMEEWESRAKRFEGVGGVRRIDAGRRFTLSDHPDHDSDQAIQKEFAVIEASWVIANNVPTSSPGPDYPHSLQGVLDEVRASQSSDTAFRVSHADGSEGFYLTQIEAQRTSVPYRSPFEHEKPETHLESAIVVGPRGEEVYTDELNRIKVQFVWDRINGGDEKASCWVRVAQSDTGSGYGGVHMPRVGEEVLIDHIGGDCDRPVVMSRLYNGATKPQWHSNGLLSGYRSKEYGGAGYNQMVMDDSSGQNRLQLLSSTANSQLHLGYLVQHTDNTRGNYLGTGFDLKSESYGAIRAGQGLYVSTYPASAGQPLDASQASGQLANAESVIEAVSKASKAANAESLQPGQDALRKFNDTTQYSIAGGSSGVGRTAGGGTGNANGFATPIMLMASPSGIALSTPASTHVSADQQINVVSGENTHLAAGKSLIASVAEKISLFVKNAGIKLFAAKGKVEIQAQSDNIEIIADQVLKLISVKQRIEITAAEEIVLNARGSYIRINGAGIEHGTPAQWTAYAGNHALPGPKSLPVVVPGFDMPKAFSNRLDVYDIYWQREFGDAEYTARNETGDVVAQGILDEYGRTPRLTTDQPETLQVLVGTQGSWLVESDAPASIDSGEATPDDPDHYVNQSA
jgi:type VI secretion system secreted protein VgrG